MPRHSCFKHFTALACTQFLLYPQPERRAYRADGRIACLIWCISSGGGALPDAFRRGLPGLSADWTTRRTLRGPPMRRRGYPAPSLWTRRRRARSPALGGAGVRAREHGRASGRRPAPPTGGWIHCRVLQPTGSTSRGRAGARRYRLHDHLAGPHEAPLRSAAEFGLLRVRGGLVGAGLPLLDPGIGRIVFWRAGADRGARTSPLRVQV